MDVREPTQSNAKILINLATPILEISSISISKSKPWLLAVGAHDSTLRIYDRRKPAPQSQGHHNSEGAVVRSHLRMMLNPSISTPLTDKDVLFYFQINPIITMFSVRPWVIVVTSYLCFPVRSKIHSFWEPNPSSKSNQRSLLCR